MSAPLTETIGIVKRFGAQMALGGVSMDVRAGEVVALAGENGAGKSTLVAICSGGKPVEPRIDTGTELVTAANAASYRK